MSVQEVMKNTLTSLINMFNSKCEPNTQSMSELYSKAFALEKKENKINYQEPYENIVHTFINTKTANC